MQDVVNVQLIKMSEIWSDHNFNCRGPIAPMDVAGLAQEISTHGLQQPITVQPLAADHPKREEGFKYRIVAGHRRFKAFFVLDRDEIPAGISEHLTEAEALILNLGENLHRQDLNIMQEAQALERLADAGMGVSDTARELNKSNTWVNVRFKLLALPEDIQNAAAAGFITQNQILELYKIKEPSKQMEAARKLKEAKMRGERAPNIRPQKKRNLFQKKIRSPQDMEWMQEHIQGVIGNNFGTRVLGWSMGHVSDLELFHDIQTIAIRAEVPYDIPYKIGGIHGVD